MSGSIMKARKGQRPQKAKTATVRGPQQGGSKGAIGTDFKHEGAQKWLK